ncbi:MAG: hypothetical protein JWP48_4654 [Actinoallomurus sp.]|jgi:hypothetical protein|nr:hypothetical protein [Actinoallomurus sp.]
MGTMIAMLVRTPYAVARLRSSQYWPGDFTGETDCGEGWRAAFSADEQDQFRSPSADPPPAVRPRRCRG